ncbi:MAG: glycosyltransferase [Phycisphaerales bacterium]
MPLHDPPPDFAIVIPAWNEEAVLPQTIAQLRECALAMGRPFELVVVDDASTDRTAEVAAAAGARVVRVERRQIAAVRNEGARATRAPWLVFCDADTFVPETVLRHALAELEAGAVGGGARVDFDATASPAAEAFIAAFKSLWYAQGLAAGCFLFARRSDFDAVGGFDELYFAGEEYWMSRALQRRGRFVLLPEAVISSARKQRKLGLVRLLSQAFAPLLRGPSVLRSRDGLPLWYGGLRDDRAVDLDLGRRGGGPGRGHSAP